VNSGATIRLTSAIIYNQTVAYLLALHNGVPADTIYKERENFPLQVRLYTVWILIMLLNYIDRDIDFGLSGV